MFELRLLHLDPSELSQLAGQITSKDRRAILEKIRPVKNLHPVLATTLFWSVVYLGLWFIAAAKVHPQKKKDTPGSLVADPQGLHANGNSRNARF